VERRYISGRGAEKVNVSLDKSGELTVPIEEFDEKLNDAQIFELYTSEEQESAAVSLIESLDEFAFFGDCVYRSANYDDAFDIYSLLRKNKIPCDEIATSADEYVLLINPEDMDSALRVIEQRSNDKKTVLVRDNIESKELYEEKDNENSEALKIIIPILIIVMVLLIRIDNEFIAVKIANWIMAFFSGG